jgi:hypothetical protein
VASGRVAVQRFFWDIGWSKIGLQKMKIMGNLFQLGIILTHHSFIDPMISFEEIMMHMP